MSKFMSHSWSRNSSLLAVVLKLTVNTLRLQSLKGFFCQVWKNANSKTWNIIMSLSKSFLAAMTDVTRTSSPKYSVKVKAFIYKWTICMIDQRSIQARRTKSFTTAKKSILKLVELPSFVAKCCKIRKINPRKKVTIFATIQFSAKMVTFSLRNTNVSKICKLREVIFSMSYDISP